MRTYFVILLSLLLIIGCSSDGSDASVPYGDKIVIQIRVHENWQSKVLLPLNSVSYLSWFKSSETYKDLNTIATFIEAIETARPLTSNKLVLYTAEFDITLLFDDQMSRKYHVNVGNDEEAEGLLVDLSEGGLAYAIPIEVSNQLRGVIFGD